MSGFTYDFAMAPLEKMGLSNLRRRLLKQASGKILELGVGTGLNLKHYPPQLEIFAIDPDDSKRDLAIRKQKESNLNVQIQKGDAEELTFKDSSFDTVVGTLVFCSIPRPERALDEAFRVLKSGGHFLLLEHVLSTSITVATLQNFLTPVWKHIAGGCHLNRDPEEAAIKAGFQLVSSKRVLKGLGKIIEFRKP
jgi:ubiquinone/menaquinone biosynthesis C-methylase UbiE